MICNLRPILLERLNKGREIGGACSAHKEDENCTFYNVRRIIRHVLGNGRAAVFT
jgi:hypothetical protein